MKFFKLLCFSLSFIIISVSLSPLVSAEALTDTEALGVISGMFDDASSAGSKVGIGIVILSGLMTLLKWDRLGKLFEIIPKQYRSFIPVVLGALIGLLQGIAYGDAGFGVLLLAFIKGALLIGGLQQVLYQQLKGTGFGDLLGTLTKA